MSSQQLENIPDRHPKKSTQAFAKQGGTKSKRDVVTQLEDDPLFSSMDSDSLLGIPDNSYFYKLPMNTELDKPSKRKSSCHLIFSKDVAHH